MTPRPPNGCAYVPTPSQLCMLSGIVSVSGTRNSERIINRIFCCEGHSSTGCAIISSGAEGEGPSHNMSEIEERVEWVVLILVK